jgi:hypothetical protein
MPDFREFIEASGMMQKDFSNLSIADRMAQGRDIGEPFIIQSLQKHGINITPAKDYHTDAKLKIDGYLNGKEPVQIKLRRSSMQGRNDIAFEVLRNHDDKLSLSEQLKDINKQGRDYRGTTVQHYFVLNQNETEIYHMSAKRLKDGVIYAIRELNMSNLSGKLTRPFTSSLKIELRPTRDPDPSSFTPFKVMAFIPVESVVETKYPIN